MKWMRWMWAGMLGMAMAVQALADADAVRYMVVDLSAGSGDDAVYPVSYLDAEPEGGWGDEYKTTKLVLRQIQPGTYTMGCETTEVGFGGYEAVPHEVTITQPFYMGVFQVTETQWAQVMGNNPSLWPGAMLPVQQVSYDDIRGSSAGAGWPTNSEVDATSFLGKLRARTGVSELDLPTEAQWEYACRAGTTTALNSGKDLTNGGSGVDPQMDEVGRYNWNQGSNKYPAPVGSYLPNAWGLYDMHGNVWEWALDWYQGRSEFSTDAVTNPVGPVSGSYRVIRAGDYNSDARWSRSASRYYYPSSTDNNPGVGMRLCCNAGAPRTVWRFYSKNYKGHFFTIDEKEKDGLIAGNPNWKFEGGAYRAYTTAAAETTALYRFYSKGYRGHFFTIDAQEAEDVKKNRNWKYEGIAYYVYASEAEGTVPVFRFWSKGYRHHFYTTDEAEKEDLVAHNPNWKYEGIAFYALPLAETGAKAAKGIEAIGTGDGEAEVGEREEAATRAGRPCPQISRAICPQIGMGVVVTTFDGTDGSAVADGDEGTGWSPEAAGAGWVALSLEEPMEVAGVEVVGEMPEGWRVLLSEDAEAWGEEMPCAARYVWVSWPEGVPMVREIRMVP